MAQQNAKRIVRPQGAVAASAGTSLFGLNHALGTPACEATLTGTTSTTTT